MNNNFKKILVFAPHTDDGELGCGGIISKFIEEGKEVYYASFSTAQASVSNKFPPNILEIEVKKATAVLGISEKNLIIYNYPVRNFLKYRQEILEDMIKLKADINPDVVFVPSLNDIHQDHKVVAEETLRAFKKNTVLGYEEPWNNIIFETRCFIPLKREHVKKKIEALRCYESQQYRSYLKDDFVMALAITRGTQIEMEYAEAFEVLRLILL